MAQKLDDSELVTFKELLLATSIQTDALAQLLIEKGIITQDEFFMKLKEVTVHTYERPDGIHIRIDRKLPTEHLIHNGWTHLSNDANPHTYPAVAFFQKTGYLRNRHLMNGFQFVNQSGLFQNVEAFRICNAQERYDPKDFIFTETMVRYDANTQLFRTSVSFKTIEQNPASALGLHALQWISNAMVQYGGQ